VDSNNSAKGRDSFDMQTGNSLVSFINRNVTPYPTEVGAPAFDLVPVTQQKDIMLNVARLHAQQEYDRIMDVVAVLQKQADDIRRRLEVTDMVHAAEYQFQVVMGNSYWLVWHRRRERTLLVMTGPTEWNTGVPEDYEYLTQVRYMGDHTWLEIDSKS
jgi:hypothetical protein